MAQRPLSPYLLRAEKLTKSYRAPNKVEILRGIDLTINRGDTVAIMGRSGEGKTTLLNLLGTLETPCGGDLQIAGQKVTFWNRNWLRNRHLAFVFQAFHLLDEQTALDNALMPARIARFDISQSSTHYKRALRLLERVGLGNRVDFCAKLLSGGERQRLALARALCNDPDLIFADEPSGNLDAESAATVHRLLLDFVKEGNKALIVVTHNIDLADLCDTRYTLAAGKLYLRTKEPL